MPDFAISDSLGNPVDTSAVKWNSASSLYNYLKSEALHLVVVPDFLQHKDELLTQVAPKPTTFDLAVQHEFIFGSESPEIEFTPGAKIELRVNTTAGSDLFGDGAFHLPATVPALTGYVGMSLMGSLSLGVYGWSGDLSFGISAGGSVTIVYLKAFPIGQGQPTLWNGTAAMISGFVIPATLGDLKRLRSGDMCAVSGTGSLKVSGTVSVALPVNPLASVNLPLGTGTLEVQDGVLAGLSVSLTLTGSYQIRVESLDGGALRLSYVQGAGTSLRTDLTASAGVSVELGTTDLLAKLLGTIGTGTVDPKVLNGLSADDVKTFNGVLKQGLDHSLRASVDYALTTSTDQATAFQYEIQPDLLDAAGTEAVNSALRGDLSLLMALEERGAAGVKLLNSVFSTAKARGVSMKVNLLGIVNLITTSKLISKCEFLFEPASGDLTIKETAASDAISAITDPYKKQQALCKAMFDSVVATTTYVVSKAITMPALACQTVHFAAHRNTTSQIIVDYTNWFVALNLMSREERTAIEARGVSGGLSTCVVRAQLDDAACEALFFDGSGSVRKRAEYVEIGRRALISVLNSTGSDVDSLRYGFLTDDATWQKAVEMGPSDQLAELIPLASTDAKFPLILAVIEGDVYDIAWWADAMVNAGKALRDMRAFLAGRSADSLSGDATFASKRDGLQKLMLKAVGASKVRFDEPWGMLCLYWAAGSRQASGKISSAGLTLERTSSAAASVAA